MPLLALVVVAVPFLVVASLVAQAASPAAHVTAGQVAAFPAPQMAAMLVSQMVVFLVTHAELHWTLRKSDQAWAHGSALVPVRIGSRRLTALQKLLIRCDILRSFTTPLTLYSTDDANWATRSRSAPFAQSAFQIASRTVVNTKRDLPDVPSPSVDRLTTNGESG